MKIKNKNNMAIDIDEDYVKYRILKHNPSLYEYMIDTEEVIIDRGIVTIKNKNYDENGVMIIVDDILGDYEVYKFLQKHSKEMISLMYKYNI